MTDMVTLNAAREAQQLAILVQRPDSSPRDQKQSNNIQISEAAVQPDAKRAPAQAEAGAQGDAQQDFTQRRDRSDAGLTGPSRPRVEIREFDVGRTPAEVVGTVDVVQRFDDNGDGRIDLIESKRATRARNSDASTYAGLATNRSGQGFLPVEGPTDAEVQAALSQTAPQRPQPGSTAASDPALRAERAVATPKFGPGAQDPAAAQTKKFGDKAALEQGFVSNDDASSQKYYGKGAEAVVAQFAAEQPQKYSDKAAAAQVGGTTEDGSGEAKYYDKVAQTEADFAGGDTDSEQKSMYERARDVDAALSEGDPDAPDAVLKTYGDALTYGPAAKAEVTAAVVDQLVKIQVTA